MYLGKEGKVTMITVSLIAESQYNKLLILYSHINTLDTF